MGPTGIGTLDQSPQAVAEWLDELQSELGWADRPRIYALLRAVLHALRDALQPGEAADLAAQLPVLLRGVYYEGWVPARTPRRLKLPEDLTERVLGEFRRDPPIDPDIAVSAALALIGRRVTADEFDDVSANLPRAVRDLFL